MIKLLIADDEKETRDSIKNMIPWKENGIEICGEAGNGSEAIRMIDNMKPDIVLLDIRMPIIDGLGVAEHIFDRKLEIESVILSGYDEFSYAQQAVRIGVSDYLLKPCKPQEIMRSISRCKNRIEQRLENHDSRFTRTRKGLISLLSEDSQVTGDPLLSTTFFENDDESYYCTLSILLDDKLTNDTSAENIITSQLQEQLPSLVSTKIDNLIAVLFQTDTIDTSEIYKKCVRTHEHLSRSGLAVSIGIGTPVTSLSQASSSYKNAVLMIEKQFFTHNNQVLGTSDKSDSIVNTFDTKQTEAQLLRAIRIGDLSKARDLSNKFFDLFRQGMCRRSNVINSTLSLLLNISQLCTTCAIDAPKILEDHKLYERLNSISTLDDLSDKVFLIIIEVVKKLKSKAINNGPIARATIYIEEHYMENLDLDALSSHVHLTPSYLCQLFKQSTGSNFIDYLNNTRIEKACDLLRTSNLKVYEIADRVGFSSRKYFTHIFLNILERLLQGIETLMLKHMVQLEHCENS